MPQSARWLRWFRFRLRTLMLFMLVVGVAIRFFSRPALDQRELVGGLVLHEKAVGVRDDGGVKIVLRNGLFLIRDRDGRTWCRGHFRDGQAIGRWTYFHENGREAWSGPCRDNVRSGVWNAWDNAGRPLAEVHHAPPATGKAQRYGSAKYGQPRMLRWSGEFRDDFPAGNWTYWDKDGESQSSDFLTGHPIGERSEWLNARLADLDSTDALVRQRAVRELTRLDSKAVPHLLAALRSPHADVQRLALEWLLRIEPRPAGLLAALERLIESDNIEVRFTALLGAVTLDESHRKTRFAQLLKFLDEKLDVRHTNWLHGVAELDSLVVPHLDAGLRDPRANVRLIAVCVLGQVGSPEAQAILLQASQHDDPAVARHAKSVLK